MSGTAQALAIVLAVGTGAFIIRMVRHGRVRVKYSLLWLTVGGLMLLLALIPSLLDRVSGMLGISYGPATLFLGSIMLLLFIAIHYSWELSRLEERTRILAEEIAMLRAPRAEASEIEDHTAVS